MLSFLLDNMFIRFGTKLYQQSVGILWVQIVAPLLRICFCFVTKLTMLSLSRENQANIIEAFNSKSRYSTDLRSIVNEYFEQIVNYS